MERKRRLVVAIALVVAVALMFEGGLFAFFPKVADRVLSFAAPPDRFAVTGIVLGNEEASNNLTVSATITNEATVRLTSVTVYADGDYFLGVCNTSGNGLQPYSSFSCSVDRYVPCSTQSVGTPRPPLKLEFVAAFADGRTSQSNFRFDPLELRCAP